MDGEAFKRKNKVSIESEEVSHLYWFSSTTQWQRGTQICLYFPSSQQLMGSPLYGRQYQSLWGHACQTSWSYECFSLYTFLAL